MKQSLRTFGLWFFVLTLSGCGTADIGEECDGAGSTDDCVDGAICTNESDKNVCRVICEDDNDCNANTESCNGVTSSNIKSCQPK